MWKSIGMVDLELRPCQVRGIGNPILDETQRVKKDHVWPGFTL